MKLHLGCGPIHFKGWENIDKNANHCPDCVMNYLCIPGNDYADMIYTCHSIEHLRWPDEVELFFAVALRLLKPGGTLRVVVPDLMKVAKLYVSGDDLKSVYGEDFEIGPGPDCAATRFMSWCRSWEHTVLFDERLLRKLMFQAGFVNIRVMPFSESDVPELLGLDRFESESISMECEKP